MSKIVMNPGDLNREWTKAIWTQDITRLNQLLTLGIPASKCSASLPMAASKGKLDAVKWLLEKAGLAKSKAKAIEALNEAAAVGHVEVIEYLLTLLPNEASGALYAACAKACLPSIQYLVEQKQADLEYKNQRTSNDYKPLHAAVMSGSLRVVKYLVETARADINTRAGKWGQTPFYVACESGHLPIVKYLFTHPLTNIRLTHTMREFHPIHVACENGHVHVVSYLISVDPACVEISDKWDWRPVHAASYHNKLDVMKCLVEQGKCQVEGFSYSDHSALDMAAGHNNMEMVVYLTQVARANVSAIDQFGRYLVDKLSLKPEMIAYLRAHMFKERESIAYHLVESTMPDFFLNIMSEFIWFIEQDELVIHEAKQIRSLLNKLKTI